MSGTSMNMVPRDYITEDVFGITDACRRYLAPIICIRCDHPTFMLPC